MRTLQKGFRRTGNPDLVNDISSYYRCSFECYQRGIVQDTLINFLGYGHLIMCSLSLYYRRHNLDPWENRHGGPSKFCNNLILKWMLKYRIVDESWISFNELTENDFFDESCWDIISKYQVLSERFIEMYDYILNFNLVLKHQVLSDSLKTKIQDRLITETGKLSHSFWYEIRPKHG